MRIIGGLALLLLTACGSAQAVGDGDAPKPPHEQYTTTTKPGHVTTTTKPGHVTTTTVKATTTTSGITTTTQRVTTTTSGGGGVTTTTVRTTTTTTQPGGGTTTTTTGGGGTTTTTTRPPTGGQFSFSATVPICPNGVPLISITFPSRPELNGQTGTLTFSTGGSTPLTFQSGATVTVPYPASAGTGPVTLSYTVGGQTATPVTVTFPTETGCVPVTTTTTPGATTTTVPSVTTTTTPGTPTTTLPPGQPFSFGAAASVCVAEVPTIRIQFVTPAQFPSLVGQTGTLTMADVNGNVVSTQPLVYQPGATVDLLYPGTRVNADGTIADVPGWNLNAAGFWVRDPSDEFLRDGIRLTYTVNPTATALVTYPPESSTCANPDGPFPPSLRFPPFVPRQPPVTPPSVGLPPTL